MFLKGKDAQADLSLRWAHNHIVNFVMRWLIWIYIDYVLFIIANHTRKFEAFSIKIKSCGIDILKIDVVF